MRARRFFGYALGLLLLVDGCHKLFGDFTLVDDGASCASGQVQCVGNLLQRCRSADNTWDNAAICASETLCDETQDKCLAPQCAAGEWRCLDADLQICNGTRDGWLTLTTCATAGHCSARSGMCTQEPCEPGDLQCNSVLLQSCKDDRSGWNDLDTCASAALCNEDDGVCDEVACGLGEFRCKGAQLQTCTDTLDGWTTIESCHSAALCDEEAGKCGSVGCTEAGAFRCGEDGALERCSDDLTGWTAVDVCKSVAHCDAVNGACMEEPCTPGEYQCNGARLEVCNTDRTGWDPVDTCETDALCQLTLGEGSTTCEPPRCAPEEFDCDDAQPLICNAGRTAFRENGDVCLTAELCNNQEGTCSMPACNPGDTRCTGAQPEICNAGRTGYVPNGDACASAALCNPSSGTCGDAPCVKDQVRCNPDNPTELQRCKADLSDWDPCATCATPDLCSASLTTTTSCDESSCVEPTCDLTDRWCGGTGNRTLYQCPESRINSQAVALDECVTNGLCELAHSQGATTCPAPTCNLTDRWCGGTGNKTLYQCPESRINSQAVALDECVTNGLCELAHSQGATTCPAPTCDLTDRWCGGTGNKTLYQCPESRINSQAVVVDTCETEGLCEQAHSEDTPSCPDPVCAVGEKQCSGSQLQVCNSARTGWTNLQKCASSTLCTSSLTPSSQMTCDVCVDGSFACDEAQPQVCNDPSTGPAVWVDSGDECDDQALCDAATGTCLCSLGDTRCNPDTENFEECQSTGWTETDVCSAGCDDDTGCL